jgi:tyrosine-protein kinase
LDAGRSDSSNLRDYLGLALRRKWVILLSLVLVPAAAVAFSMRQQSLYNASAEVLLGRQSDVSVPGTSGGGGNGSNGAARTSQTQADLARTPAVALAALKRAGLSSSKAKILLADSSVTPSKNSDILGFSVTNHNPKLAVKLVNAYATAYVDYRKSLDTGALKTAAARIQAQINALAARGDRTSTTYQNAVDRLNAINTEILLQTQNATLVKPATHSTKTQPTPTRSGLIGLALGLVLGLGLAFLWETLDTRVRTAEGIGDRLGLPLLGRIAEPPRKLRGENKLVMIDDPGGRNSEAFRVLRTNLEFANLERGANTILVTSAVQGEGKSTTAANLAVALAYAGRHVVLVNLDLRRPHQGELFHGTTPSGLTAVALGRISLDEALIPVALAGADDLLTLEQGLLEVLDTGQLPPSPGDFLLTNTLAEILEQLAERADIVLIDAPPLLTVGDTLILSSKVDAILLIARMGIVRRPMLKELRRVLQACPAVKLGFVLTGAQSEEGYSYAYSRQYESATARARQASEELQ